MKTQTGSTILPHKLYNLAFFKENFGYIYKRRSLQRIENKRNREVI